MIPKRFCRGRVTAACMAACVIGAALVTLADTGCSRFASRGMLPGPVQTENGVRFRYYAPGASRVQLAGNWPGNNWAKGDGSAGEANIGLMNVDANGVWEITIPLGPGRYEYLFWVDENTWRLDPGNPEEGSAGPMGRSSLLVVFGAGNNLEIR